MWLIVGIKLPARTFAPEANHLFKDPLYWLNIFIAWAKVPAIGVTFIAFAKRLGQYQITAQWLKYMLPWASCFWISNDYGLLLFKCPENIGNQAICSPIATTNNIS